MSTTPFYDSRKTPMGLPCFMTPSAAPNQGDDTTAHPWTTIKVETDGKLTAAQDIAGIVLSTLEQASRIAPVPYLQDAVGLAVALFDMVQRTSENKSAFQSLANDACGLVCAAMNVWKDREVENNGAAIHQDLMNHLKELLNTLNDVTEFANARAARGTIARFVSHK
ncbi:hypothetical protein EYR40_004635 [Pleurotus pulmonarius]|nr:hypothetical protein EYR40_004635 [Pleurotus pulmonarius]